MTNLPWASCQEPTSFHFRENVSGADEALSAQLADVLVRQVDPAWLALQEAARLTVSVTQAAERRRRVRACAASGGHCRGRLALASHQRPQPPEASRPSHGPRSVLIGVRGTSGPDGRPLVRGCAAKVVFDERLGCRLLVDDHVPLRSPNHVFEFLRLVAREKREAISLLSNFLVLGNCHLDPLCAAKIAALAFTALAEELKAERSVLRGHGLVDLLDSLVHFADECFVSRLPLKTGIHNDSSTPPATNGQEPPRFARGIVAGQEGRRTPWPPGGSKGSPRGRRARPGPLAALHLNKSKAANLEGERPR